MNTQNARSIGRSDGETWISNGLMNCLNPEEKALWSQTLTGQPSQLTILHDARSRAVYTYRVKAQKTIDLYVAGWQDAINTHESQQAKEREKAARHANIPHNPNTRFCTCAKCSE